VTELKPKIILLENVPMKSLSEEVITTTLGIDPVMINSALLSAQNRKRLYWFGIRQEDGTYQTIPVEQPDDLGLVMADILEDNYITDRDKSYCIDANYFKGGNLRQYFDKKRRQLVFESDSLCKQVGVADVNGWDILKRVYSKYGKGPSQTCNLGGNRITKVLISKVRDKSKTVRVGGRGSYDRHEWDSVDQLHWRKLTVLEVERLQTLPDNYTEFGVFRDAKDYDPTLHEHLQKKKISNTRRYKAVGNGWTVSVIKYLFGHLVAEAEQLIIDGHILEDREVA
jgi:site-specific DNA-cytosine methylase